MSKKRRAPLAPGTYLATCREATPLAAAVNGHCEVWPEATLVVEGDTAIFYKGGERVWSCNAIYAAHQFDISPARGQ